MLWILLGMRQDLAAADRFCENILVRLRLASVTRRYAILFFLGALSFPLALTGCGPAIFPRRSIEVLPAGDFERDLQEAEGVALLLGFQPASSPGIGKDAFAGHRNEVVPVVLRKVLKLPEQPSLRINFIQVKTTNMLLLSVVDDQTSGFELQGIGRQKFEELFEALRARLGAQRVVVPYWRVP